MTNNKCATRYYSNKQEKSVAIALNGKLTPNSGASKFSGGDVVIKEASMLIECKCAMSEKNSVSIKKEWLEKNKNEGFSCRLPNNAVCINFGPDSNNYYVINERLMKFLVDKLVEENE